MCDSVVAVGAEAASGVTLFARNSDRNPGECQTFLQLPAAYHPPLARLRCTHVEIAQVAETYRVMGHSPEWAWGFEHGVNEHGVAIGSHSVFSNEQLEEQPGLIGMDLVRLGLERGRDARESLEVIAGLIETHGQGGAALSPDGPGSHNSFLLADPESAWLLETSNRHWAARRVRSASCSNHYSLGRDWEIASRELENDARAAGWWKRSGRIDVAAAFRDPHVPFEPSEGRQRRTRAWLAARARHDPVSFQQLLRDHGAEGARSPHDLRPDPELDSSVCHHGAQRLETATSLIAPLPAERVGVWPVWIGFATPCSGIFLPVYLDGVLPERLARADAYGAWQSFEQLQRVIARDAETLVPRVREGFAALEAQIEHERIEVERDARVASLGREPDRAALLLTEFMARTLEAALERTDTLAHALRSC